MRSHTLRDSITSFIHSIRSSEGSQGTFCTCYIAISIISLHSTVTIGFKQGDALPPLIYNFALEYAISRVEVNLESLKLNGTYQLLVYADDVNISGGSVHTVQENAELC